MRPAPFFCLLGLLVLTGSVSAVEPAASRAKALTSAELSARIDKLINDNLADSNIPPSTAAPSLPTDWR